MLKIPLFFSFSTSEQTVYGQFSNLRIVESMQVVEFRLEYPTWIKFQ